MDVTVHVEPKRIADLMVTAIEHNAMTRAWCAGVYLANVGGRKIELETHWYADEVLYAGPFQLEILEIIDESKKPIGTNVKKHIRSQSDFAAAFQLMAGRHGHHFGDFMAGNEDAVTADVFLQLVALGEVVYG